MWIAVWAADAGHTRADASRSLQRQANAARCYRSVPPLSLLPPTPLMGRGGRIHHHHHVHSSHRRYVPPPPEPVPQGVGGIHVQGAPPSCGCPNCHNGSQIAAERVLPPSFADIYTEEEWSVLIHQLDLILDHVLPIFPVIFAHMCIPFSPVCAILHYAKKQKKAVAEVVAKENARLEPQGLYWTHTPNRAANNGAFMCLSWRPEVRPAWEALNPSRRPISREPLPAEFYSDELKMAVALAQVQQQALMINQGAAGGVQMVPMYGAAALAPGAQPAQGYGQQAWGQPSPQAAGPQQQYMGGGPSSPSAASAAAAPASQPQPQWSPNAPIQQPQWVPPSQSQVYAPSAPANTTEGGTSSSASPPMQSESVGLKRFCAGWSDLPLGMLRTHELCVRRLCLLLVLLCGVV